MPRTPLVQRRNKYDSLKYAERFRKLDIKNVFYFDGGEFDEFVGLVSPDGQLIYNQWDLRFYKGEPGTLIWFGDDTFYRDTNPLKLKNYRNFGLPAWPLPEGSRPAQRREIGLGDLDTFDLTKIPRRKTGLHQAPPAAAGATRPGSTTPPGTSQNPDGSLSIQVPAFDIFLTLRLGRWTFKAFNKTNHLRSSARIRGSISLIDL